MGHQKEQAVIAISGAKSGPVAGLVVEQVAWEEDISSRPIIIHLFGMTRKNALISLTYNFTDLVRLQFKCGKQCNNFMKPEANKGQITYASLNTSI